MQAASHCYPLHFSGRGRYSTVSNHARVSFLSLNCLSKKFDFNQGAQIQKVLKSSKSRRLYVIPNSTDGYPSRSVSEEDTTASKKDTSTVEEWENGGETFLSKWSPPRYLWRGLSVFILAGQVIIRIIKGKIHWKNTLQQLERVGPKSVGVCLLTAAFVGMAFTIQFVREFTRLGLNRSVGGVLALAFSRELSPVVTAVVVAGRIGSAFAAELGTMQVSEQTDTLRVLGANPVDYLVTPRVIASCIALPFLTLMCFTVGMASSALLADGVYGISINIILDSAQRALRSWDLISAMIKSQVFGAIISIISCAWGVTTLGGAKGVGESTTSAVVLSLVGIFIADFALSCCFFQGAGDSLRNCNDDHLHGYNEEEVKLIALLVRHHRKKLPECDHVVPEELTEEMRGKIRILCAILRVSAAVEKHQLVNLDNVEFSHTGEGYILVLEAGNLASPGNVLPSVEDFEAELGRELEHFRMVFQERLSIAVTSSTSS